MTQSVGHDRRGAEVVIGSKVRLLSIRASVLKRIRGEHAERDVSSMLGQVVDVFDVYEDGQVWVSATFPKGAGLSEVHAIAVDPDAIELVSAP